ncbi:hypothetical protein ACHAWT_008710 [Skeletonema menzelii]
MANMVTFKLPLIQPCKERNQYLQILLSGLDDRDAGLIFADPIVKKAAEELFVPCAFNTWDRHNSRLNQPMRKWGAGLANS